MGGQTSVEILLQQDMPHQLPVPVLGEFLFGLMRSSYRNRLESALLNLVKEWIVLEVTFTTCRHYADIREELRVAGTPISPNDIWIAAISREHGLEVASKDTDFDRVRGLVRRSW